jgi:hypothetical protein
MPAHALPWLLLMLMLLLPSAARSSLGFAGTILVRSDEEVAYVKQQGPGAILAAVGQPW